jgi:anti-sigma-K factor RskA
VQKAIDDFAYNIEKQAMTNAVAPPQELKEKILKSLPTDDRSTSQSKLSLVKDVEIESYSAAPVKSIKGWRMAAAASVIALSVSAALNVYFFNKYTSTSAQYQALLLERNSLQASNNVYQTKLGDWQLAARMAANPGMLKVTLKGVPGKESNLMSTVFWDKATKDVYIMANILPAPAPDKQYQLWALVDGKPVDAGMLDPNCQGACKMKNIPRAQAFAITLEKRGGNPTPTMDQMFVMGSI